MVVLMIDPKTFPTAAFCRCAVAREFEQFLPTLGVLLLSQPPCVSLIHFTVDYD